MIFDRIKLNKELGDLKFTIDEQSQKIEELKKKKEFLEAQCNASIKELHTITGQAGQLQKELRECKAKLRDQTAGDLLFNAIKAINAPKEELPKYQSQQEALMNLYRQQSSGQSRIYEYDPPASRGLISNLLGWLG